MDVHVTFYHYQPCKNAFLDLQQLKNDGNKVSMKVKQRPGWGLCGTGNTAL